MPNGVSILGSLTQGLVGSLGGPIGGVIGQALSTAAQYGSTLLLGKPTNTAQQVQSVVQSNPQILRPSSTSMLAAGKSTSMLAESPFPFVVARKRRRSMQVTNMRALNRALRRLEGFQKVVNRVTKATGGKARVVKTKRGCRK